MKVTYKDIIDLANKRNFYDEYELPIDATKSYINSMFKDLERDDDDFILTKLILTTPKYREVYDQALDSLYLEEEKDLETNHENNKTIHLGTLTLGIIGIFVIIFFISINQRDETINPDSILTLDPTSSLRNSKIFETKEIVNTLKTESDPDEELAENIVFSNYQDVVSIYFSLLKEGSFKKAYNLFGEQKKINAGGFEKFSNWLVDLEDIQNLDTKYLDEISSDEEKIYLANFIMKFSEKEDLDSKWIFYLKEDDNRGWYIHKSLVAYENGWNDYACKLYSSFEICPKNTPEDIVNTDKLREFNKDTEDFKIILENNNYSTKDDWLSIRGTVPRDISSLTLYSNGKESELRKIYKDNGANSFTNLKESYGENYEDGIIYLGFRSGEDFQSGHNEFTLVTSKGDKKIEQKFNVYYNPNKIVGANRFAEYSDGVGFYYPKELNYSNDSFASRFHFRSLWNWDNRPRIAKADTTTVSSAGKLQTEELDFFSHKIPNGTTLNNLKDTILNDIESSDIEYETVYFKNIAALLIKYTEPEDSPIREKVYMLTFIKNSELFSLSYAVTIDDFKKQRAENMLNSIIISNTQYRFF